MKRSSHPTEVAFSPWTPLVTVPGAFSCWWFSGRI